MKTWTDQELHLLRTKARLMGLTVLYFRAEKEGYGGIAWQIEKGMIWKLGQVIDFSHAARVGQNFAVYFQGFELRESLEEAARDEGLIS